MKLILLFIFNTITIGLVHAEVIGNKPKIIAIGYNLGKEGIPPTEFIPFSKPTSMLFGESYWVKVKFWVPREDNYVLKGGNLYMQNMKFYGDHFKWLSSGNLHEMHLKKGYYTIYIYSPFEDFQDKSGISINLINSSIYFKQQFNNEVYHQIFISILMFMCLLSLSFYFISKAIEKLYFYYAWYLFSIIFFFSYQYGILGKFWIYINHVSPYIIWVSSASLSLSYLFFAQTFLTLRKTDPFVFKIIRFGKYFIVSIVLIELGGFLYRYDVQHNAVYKSIVLLVQVTLIPIIVYRVYKQKTILSWILFWGAIILGFTTIGGQVASVIKATDETNFYIQLALLLEVFVFSVGLGIRMWIIEEEKRKTQISLLKQMEQNVTIQQEYTFELENKVRERTSDLHIKNNEKDLLLKEIHHRVKNNLQTIASLLSIQLRRLTSTPAKLAIEDSMNRVKVMGLIHKFLYKNDTYTSIDLKEYVNQLLGMLIDSSSPKKRISKKVEVDSIILDIDRAISIGLILNELVTNSIKHAFTYLDNPILMLHVKKRGTQVCITFSDNGNLLSVDVFRNSKGFGWKLINSLINSLDGQLEHRVNQGFEVKITFPYPSL